MDSKECHYKPDFTVYFEQSERYDQSGFSVFNCKGSRVVGQAPFPPGCISVEIDAKVKRIDPDKAHPQRPFSSKRYLSTHNFLPRNEKGEPVEPSCYAWMVQRYIEQDGLSKTKRDLRDGLIKEIHMHE